MKESIYIFSNGSLKRKDNTLYYETNEGKKKFIPVENVKEIFLFGEFSLNNKLLNFLTTNQIMLHYFNYYDYYSGTFYPREHYNSGYMILKQATAYNDFSVRIHIARKFVEGAIKNTLMLLKYYHRRDKDVAEHIEDSEKLLRKIEEAGDIPTLMQVEGTAKEIYYDSFNKIIDNSDFSFTGRSRRPPKDYLNALISFSNSMIYT